MTDLPLFGYSPGSPEPPSVEDGDEFKNRGSSVFDPFEYSALEEGEYTSPSNMAKKHNEKDLERIVKNETNSPTSSPKDGKLVIDCSPVSTKSSNSSKSSASESQSYESSRSSGNERKRWIKEYRHWTPKRRRDDYPDINYPCPNCNRDFRCREYLCCHLFSVHHLAMCCAYCDAHFKNSQKLLNHIKSQHFNGKSSYFQCWFCDDTFINAQVFWHHSWSRHRAKMCRCLHCGLVCFGHDAYRCHRSLCDNLHITPIFKERKRTSSQNESTATSRTVRKEREHKPPPQPLMSLPPANWSPKPQDINWSENPQDMNRNPWKPQDVNKSENPQDMNRKPQDVNKSENPQDMNRKPQDVNKSENPQDMNRNPWNEDPRDVNWAPEPWDMNQNNWNPQEFNWSPNPQNMNQNPWNWNPWMFTQNTYPPFGFPPWFFPNDQNRNSEMKDPRLRKRSSVSENNEVEVKKEKLEQNKLPMAVIAPKVKAQIGKICRSNVPDNKAVKKQQNVVNKVAKFKTATKIVKKTGGPYASGQNLDPKECALIPTKRRSELLPANGHATVPPPPPYPPVKKEQNQIQPKSKEMKTNSEQQQMVVNVQQTTKCGFSTLLGKSRALILKKVEPESGPVKMEQTENAQNQIPPVPPTVTEEPEIGYCCIICDHMTQWKVASYEHLRKEHNVPPSRCPKFSTLKTRLLSSQPDSKNAKVATMWQLKSNEKPVRIEPTPEPVRILPKEPETKVHKIESKLTLVRPTRLLPKEPEKRDDLELEQTRNELETLRAEFDRIKEMFFSYKNSTTSFLSHHDALQMAATELQPANESEQRVINEFSQLVEKSKQLFNGIRDLPQHGTKQWQGYFGRTFDIYTRLWKFQQQHRQILDKCYGLKRWQIGEIASKIGQLYYHYYLRTSETSYLLETFSFYSAIRSRAYYSRTVKEENSPFRPDLTVKKLRYYARFIVVCLLLKKLKLVRDLVRELSRQVEEYIATFDPEDQLEWTLILTEIKSFVEADNIVSIVDVDNSTVILSHRLTPYNTPPLEKGVPFWCSLQEVLIVGNCMEQVKCTELSLDMFWMLQALEREPHEELSTGVSNSSHHDSSPAPGRSPYDDAFMRTSGKENPHKYLLYKPSFTQLLLFLTSGLRELPPNGAMLLYISGDGAFVSSQKRHGSQAYDIGGVATNARKEGPEGEHQNLRKVSNPSMRDIHCIHPGDLYPFLRKPFFLIVDSDNSTVFLGLPNLFGQPCVTLVSPVNIPPYLLEQPKRGSILTLFLHSPLTAFCYICNISEISIALWDKCQAHIDKFICDAGRLLVRSQSIERSFIDFYGDDFLRLLILRFIFCSCTLRIHRSFRANPAFHPHCHPPIPETDVLQNPSLARLVLDLACILDVLAAFRDADETIC